MDELSKEEKQAIKNIEKFAKGIDLSCVSAREMHILLDLYKQEKDRNIELATTIDALNTDLKQEKEKNKNLIDTNKKLYEMAQRTAIQELINYDYISKDKIKAKIEPKLKELEKEIDHEWKKYGNSKELQDMEDMYNFLQELLEK